jgi:hypothetical protein
VSISNCVTLIKSRKQLSSFSVGVALAALCCKPISANDLALAEIATKYGVGLIQSIELGSARTLRPNITIDEERKALQRILDDYEIRKRLDDSGIAVMRSTSTFVIDTTAVALTASGFGAVPAAVLKGAASAASDAVFDSLHENMRQQTKNYLFSNKDKIVSLIGAGGSLVGKSPEEIRSVLQKAPELLDDIRAMAGDDVDLATFSGDVAIDVLRTTQIATLSAVGQQGVKLREAITTFGEFRKNSERTLQEHGARLGDLERATARLNGAVSTLQTRMNKSERDLAIIGDFAFERMGAREKANALKDGFQNAKFECKDGKTDCDSSKLRDQLIERYEAEADLKETAASFAKSVQYVGYAAKIAGDLGINIPGLDTAASIGSQASEAFLNFASGNYIGAIASVTGMFAKKKRGPSEVAVLRQYLDRQFERVNAQLRQIIEQQDRIMDGLVALSKQMHEQYVALDKRIGRIEFETKRLSSVVRQAYRRYFTACHAIYAQFNDDVRSGHIEVSESGDFSRIEDIFYSYKIHQGAADATLQRCVDSIKEGALSLSAVHFFGNFLDVRSSLKDYPSELPPTESKEESLEKPALESFFSDIFDPSRRLALEALAKRRINLSRGYELLANPLQNTASLTNRLSRAGLASTRPFCAPREQSAVDLQQLLCGAKGSEAIAGGLLENIMLADDTVEFAQWGLVASRIYDLEYAQTASRFELAAFAQHAKEQPNDSRGQKIVQYVLSTLNAAIASHSLLYSELTITGALDIMAAPKGATPELEKVRQARLAETMDLLSKNKLLGANVVLELMRQKSMDVGGALPTYSSYRRAYNAAFEGGRDPFFWLRGLFGEDAKFRSDPARGLVEMHVGQRSGQGGELWVEIPFPEVFVDGTLRYPSSLVGLLKQRDIALDRLEDYAFFKRAFGDDHEKRADLIEVISRRLAR